jgi:ATP-dependent Clp protease ATP-binding subunit ClpC
MIDLGSMADRFSWSGQKVMRRAIELSMNFDHHHLSVAHIFTAIGDVEGALFQETMQSVSVNPQSVNRLLDEELAKKPQHLEIRMAIPELTLDLFNSALRRARSLGRQQIDSYDLIVALFTDPKGLPADILRRLGVDPVSATETISQLIRIREEQDANPKRSKAP